MRFCRVVTNGLNFLFLLLVFVHSSSTNLSLLSFWFIHNAPLRVNSGQSPIDRKVTTRPSSPSSSSLSSSSLREIYGDDLEDNGDSAGFRFECTIQDADCAVRRVDCNNEVIPYVDSPDELPPSAYDVRVEPFARAVPQKAERYWLSVSISWQVPTNTLHMPPKAFLLEVTALNIISSSNSCFLFNISGSQWTPYLLTSSPRLHFSTENLFKFGDSYEVNVISLPRSAAMASMTTKKITMPGRPDLNTANSGLHFDCSRFSNSDASKWTAGFRHVSVYSLPRTIHIEFVGAPPHYCFEAYEVRLKDGTRQDLLRSSIIPVKAMHTEYVGDNAVTFGEYNFTNLEVGKDYVPSVIPMERAEDGRCLCPVTGTDPHNKRVVCSCVAADSRMIRFEKLEKPMNQEGKKDLLSKVVTEITPRHYRDTIWSVLLLILLFLILFILVVLTYFLSVKYRRDQLSGKTVRIRFTSDRTRGLETPSVVPICQTPLIRNTNLRVLLVYSHDCAAHDAAVLSLAEYLRDCLNFEVHLDMWDSGEINRNLMDYITLSILNADKILIINSVGALYRYRDKVKREFRITRNRPGPYDDLFALQIDQALTCSSVISVRFCYTTFQIVLPPLSYALQYVLPDNLDLLISAMTETKMNIDPRRFSFSSSLSKLFSAVENMNDLIHSDRRWFERDHYHIPVVPCQPLDVLSKNASGEVASVRWNLFTEKQMPRTSISLSNEYERLLVTSVTRPTALEINSERISCSNRIPYTDHIYGTNSPPSERQSEPTFGVTVQIGSDVSHIPTHATDRDTSGSWDHLKGYAVSSQTDSGVFSCPFTTNLTL